MLRYVSVLPGTVSDAFPGIEVLGELGRGAQTVVYRIRRDGREYALKLLPAADGERALTALRREAALLASVDHPGLPRIFEVGRVAAGSYLVLELIEGRPLSQVLADGTLTEEAAVRLAVDLVGPLTAAHRAGLVHRDLKPANVIISGTTTPTVARLID